MFVREAKLASLPADNGPSTTAIPLTDKFEPTKIESEELRMFPIMHELLIEPLSTMKSVDDVDFPTKQLSATLTDPMTDSPRTDRPRAASHRTRPATISESCSTTCDPKSLSPVTDNWSPISWDP